MEKNLRNEVKGEFVVSLLESNMKSFPQNLFFSIYSLNERQCLLVFKHVVFKKIIDSDY
jgi:hypothetical protein